MFPVFTFSWVGGGELYRPKSFLVKGFSSIFLGNTDKQVTANSISSSFATVIISENPSSGRSYKRTREAINDLDTGVSFWDSGVVFSNGYTLFTNI